MVLGFQGKSQLETRYGHDAEAMLSQPATKIFLGTTEAHAATWISETIGEVEIERLRESRSNVAFGQPRPSTSFGLERQVEPLVMASEITGLEPLHGYLKLGNLVVRLSGSFVDLPDREPAFVERPMLTRARDAASAVAPDIRPVPPHPPPPVPDTTPAAPPAPDAAPASEPYWL
jgi:hypothetical protein